MRLAGENGNLGAGNLPPDTLDDMIEVDVVFQRIGARDILVVRVLNAKHQTGGLIDLSG